MCFYDETFGVLTEDLHITGSVQSAAVYSVNWGFVEKSDI